MANGKPANPKDLSMSDKYDNGDTVADNRLGQNALADMTDKVSCPSRSSLNMPLTFVQENDEFIYVL